MVFQIITLFPEMVGPVLSTSMMWKASEKGLAEFRVLNLRDFGLGPRHQVDDTPYGGGDGMLLMCEPIFAAVEYAKAQATNSKVILTTPKGSRWQQGMAAEFAERGQSGENYIILCGHYEGFDERILTLADHQVSIGDYVLTGGELPALVFVDSIVRLIPGVLGGEQSAQIESFSDGKTLEFPQYTRPAEFRGMKVPDVLLSGNHGEIAKWRKEH